MIRKGKFGAQSGAVYGSDVKNKSFLQAEKSIKIKYLPVTSMLGCFISSVVILTLLDLYKLNINCKINRNCFPNQVFAK